MNRLDFEDEANEVLVIADKANAVAEYLMQGYFGKRDEAVSAEELKYGYKTANVFSQILQDYTCAALDKLESLCEKISQADENESPV